MLCQIATSMAALACLLLATAPSNAQNPHPVWTTKASLPVWSGSWEQRYQDTGQRVFVSEDRSRVFIVLGKADSVKVEERLLLNRSLPSIQCSISRGADGGFVYSYSVGNGGKAVDPIGAVWLVVDRDAQLQVLHRVVSSADAWGGGAGAPVGKQILPNTPVGNYVVWLASHREGSNRPVIAPGTTVQGFELSSNFAPGFATAYFSHWDYVSVNPRWPEDVQRQLAAFWEDKSQREPHLLTVGPMFAKSTPPQVITEHFIAGLEWLASFSTPSAFLLEVKKLLSSANTTKSVTNRGSLVHQPTTEFERQLLQSLYLSLGWPLDQREEGANKP